MPWKVRRLCAIVIAAALLSYLNTIIPVARLVGFFRSPWSSSFPPSSLSRNYHQWGPFFPSEISGFAAAGVVGQQPSCDALTHHQRVSVQKSLFLEDDLERVAADLDSHPGVSYPDGPTDDLARRPWNLIRPFWERQAGSSVWLPDQGVFLLVSRIVHFQTTERNRVKISFLRGQLFSSHWEPLEDQDLTWGDTTFTFPLVFDIPVPLNDTGVEFGPEDPRIIREDAAEAEPVIVFNMLAPHQADWKRAMYAFRPFSNTTTLLTIRGRERRWTEKNWAPFFTQKPAEPDSVRGPSPHPPDPHRESQLIHFVYSFRPLEILQCDLPAGDCNVVFKQALASAASNSPDDVPVNLRGGTNLVPVPPPRELGLHEPRPAVQAWLSIPRTNDPQSCTTPDEYRPIYRPEIVVMVSDGDAFHIRYASSPLTFGDYMVQLEADDDPCEKGRRMIPNSIPFWDVMDEASDVLGLTFSIDDASVQVTHIQGLLELVHRLSSIWTPQAEHAPLMGPSMEFEEESSLDTRDDVVDCSVRSARTMGQDMRTLSDSLGRSQVGPAS